MRLLMGNRGAYILICIGYLLLSSCGQSSFDTEEALWEYLKDEDNGYLQKKSIRGVEYSLLYKPTDLLVLQEVGNKKDPLLIDSLRRKYSKYVYFNLSMSRGNQELLNSVAGDRQQFGAMVSQLAFGMHDKIHLYTETKDTIPMLDYNYPRMYGMSKSTSMLLVYPREDVINAQEVNLTIEDLGFGTGEVRFYQKGHSIKDQPKLRL